MTDLEDVKAILDVFQQHGHYEVKPSDFIFRRRRMPNTSLVPMQIDTARVYTRGTSEEYLGQIGWKERGLVMDTKLYPTIVSFAPISQGCLVGILMLEPILQANPSGMPGVAVMSHSAEVTRALSGILTLAYTCHFP